MSKILEEAENLQGERIATVETARGEVRVNVDQAVCAVADAAVEQRHERHMGWDIGPGFFREWFDTVQRSIVR